MSQIDWQKPAAPKLWRSLEQLETGPRQEREAVDLRIGDDGWSRRDFLTLVGMATVAGCFREPPENQVHFPRAPAPRPEQQPPSPLIESCARPFQPSHVHTPPAPCPRGPAAAGG